MGRKKKEPYFGENQEKAVVDYINSDSAEEKDKIYNTYLAEPFRIMKESILRRYNNHIGNYDVHEVESNALSHLLEQMVKFNPDAKTKSGRRTKAFSYCQTIIRNYYIDHSKRSYFEKKTNLCFDNYSDAIEEDLQHSYTFDDDTNVDTTTNLIATIIKKIKTEMMSNKNLKPIEISVGDAIINVLQNWDILFLEETSKGRYQKKNTNKFAKNKVLLLLKEQTGLSTKDMRLAMKGFKDLYFIEKEIFYGDDE